MRIFICGFGTVGQGFAEVIAKRREFLEDRYGCPVLITGAMDSRTYVIDRDGLDPIALVDRKKVTGRVGEDEYSDSVAVLDQAAGTDHDPDLVTDAEATELLATEGLPDGANADVAVCLLMCAMDAAAAGEKDVAANLTLRARDLVGEPAAKALLELIRESDAEGGADGQE